MEAKFISTEGEYLEALIELNGKVLHVMDEFSSKESCPGEMVQIEILPGLFHEDEDWESIFSGNPKSKRVLEHLSGWRYRAYGIITTINPVMVDVGLFEIESPISSSDQMLIGEAVAFTIERLEASAANTSPNSEARYRSRRLARPLAV